MKRYDIYQSGTRVWETDNGKFCIYSSADGVIKELYGVINRNSKKLIKQQARIKELKKDLNIVYKSLIAKDYIAAIEILSEILERE